MTRIPPMATAQPTLTPLGTDASLRGGLIEARRQVVYAVTGDLVLSTAASFERRINSLAAGTVGDLVLDLSRMDFADSSGLRSLVRLREQMTAANRRLVLRDPSGPIRRLLNLAGFDGLFETEHASALARRSPDVDG